MIPFFLNRNLAQLLLENFGVESEEFQFRHQTVSSDLARVIFAQLCVSAAFFSRSLFEKTSTDD